MGNVLRAEYGLKAKLLGIEISEGCDYMSFTHVSRIDFDFAYKVARIDIWDEEGTDFVTIAELPIEQHEEVFKVYVALLNIHRLGEGNDR